MANPFLLLVEGKDDEHVLYHLLEHHRVPQAFRIKNKNGIENLLETLDVELLAGGLERLGIIVDADTDPASRWQSLRNILTRSGYPNVPAEPEPTGTIVEHGRRPAVGLWVMPNNQAPGMLEDFMRSLVRAGDVLLGFAATCVQEVVTMERRFPAVHESKAVIHTWLAWQEEPGTPLGLAIKNSYYLDAEAPQARHLIAWVRRLFQLDASRVDS